MPKVSVLIPSYNLADTITETIESVQAQSFEDWELIISDDGSTDNSLEVIQPFLSDARITLMIRTENKGQNYTTNELVKAATGEYLCCLPADDLIEPEKLQKQVEYLDANPDCGIVFGLPRFFTENGPCKYPHEGIENIRNMSRQDWQRRFRMSNCLFIATSMHRRSLHDEIGLFSEDLHLLADLEFYIRVTQKHDIHVLQEPMARIRTRKNRDNLSYMTPENVERHCDELDVVRERHYKVDPKKFKVMLATPFYEVKGYSPYIVSLVQTVTTLTAAKIPFEYVELSGDSYVWRARNLLAERFLNSDCTHLFFLDSDQGWTVDSFLRVLRADADIVGGAYPTKNNWESYSAIPLGMGDADGNAIPDCKDNGLIPAGRLPTGFMKIKREVFEKIKAENPTEWYWESNSGSMRKVHDYFGHIRLEHVAYGEDISFNIRCEHAGFDLWIEPRCDISHIGVKTWIGNFHEYLTKQPGGSNDPERLAA